MPSDLDLHGFPVDSALRAGVSRKRLRSMDLERPFWGVRASAGSILTMYDLAVACSARLPDVAAFSHVTAARLWGIPLPWELERRPGLDIAVPVGHFVPARRGVRGHRLAIEPEDIVQLDRLRITSLARTWCDLGALLNEEGLVAAGDFLLWRRRPPAIRLHQGDIEAAFARFAGARGRTLLKKTMPILCDRSDSPPESSFRVRFLRAGLPTPAVNPMIYDKDGNFVAMPDLAFMAYKVAFDYEGDHHRTDPVQWEKDIARVPRFEDLGWLHLRAGKSDLRNPDATIRRLTRRLRLHGWSG